jgi:hypothetical protein
MAKSKTVTRDQAEGMKAKAADFMERMGDDDRAADFDAMTVDEYAEHKGLTLSNPSRKRNCKRRSKRMAGSGFSKSELEGMVDDAIDVLDDAYDPASSREDLANAVGSALDILRGEDDSSDSDDEDEDQD